MITPEEETLQIALQEAGLRALPKEWKPESSVVWITAIALVTKVGCRREYVYCHNSGYNLPSVAKDYGACAAIISFDAIYPVEILDKRFTPDLRSNDAIIKFLAKNGHQASVVASLLSKDGKTPEEIKKDKAIVKSYVNQAAIVLAKKTLAEESRVNEIRNYANRIKNGDTEEVSE